jgi:hypothetical protein
MPAPIQPAPNHPIIDLTGEVEYDPDIIYPSVNELIAELDELMPVLRFPQYEDRLLTAGFRYVHLIANTPTVRAMLSNLGIPVGIVEEIVDRAGRMMRRAAKSKSPVKHEDSHDES